MFWVNRIESCCSKMDRELSGILKGEKIFSGGRVSSLNQKFNDYFIDGAEEVCSSSCSFLSGYKITLAEHRNLGPQRPSVIARPCHFAEFHGSWVISPAGVHYQNRHGYFVRLLNQNGEIPRDGVVQPCKADSCILEILRKAV